MDIVAKPDFTQSYIGAESLAIILLEKYDGRWKRVRTSDGVHLVCPGVECWFVEMMRAGEGRASMLATFGNRGGRPTSPPGVSLTTPKSHFLLNPWQPTKRDQVPLLHIHYYP